MSHVTFLAKKSLGGGPLSEAVGRAFANPGALIFGPDGRVVDIDPTRPPPEPEAKGPGRPKLGVTAREVTLLPRHWEWLATQSGGASVALRKLVEAASRDPKAERNVARDAAYRFASAMGGDEAGFEEAMRALYAGKRKKFHRQLESWPPDVREHLEKMAAPAFTDDAEES
jgi:hypothetical protein